MKRILAIVLLLQTNVLVADTIFGGEVGGYYWSYSVDGAYADSQNLTRFSFDDSDEMVIYASLEHPIPLIPNIKLRNNPLENDGSVTLNSDFDFEGVTFPVGTEVATQSNLTNRDIVLYYEFLDNSLVSFDLGANFKWIDGSFTANSLTTPGLGASQDIQVIVPMLYGKLRADLWGTGLYGAAEANYIGMDDNHLQDYQISVGYALIDNLAITLNVEAGYRVMDLQVEDVDDIYADFRTDGAWLGIALDF
jgi:outer membrane protein